MDKRNVVLITLDSVRADHCSFMGYSRKTTPTIDRMARKGIVFTNAIASSVPTGPSIFSLFTSKYLNTSKILDPTVMRSNFKKSRTLAEVLRSYYYKTIAIHNHPWLSEIFGFNKGFEYYLYNVSEFITGRRSSIRWFKDFIKLEGVCLPWEKYYQNIINNIKKLKKPWFMWTILLDTHTPYLPPKHARKWSKSPLSTLKLMYYYTKLRFLKSKHNKKIQLIIDAYDSILYADLFIKRLWEDLKDYDPIVIIHADHGDGFGEHGYYSHPPMLYEELIHIPLVIYNADARYQVDNPFSLIKLANIVLNLLGIEESLYPISYSIEKIIDHNEYEFAQVFENGKRKIAIRLKDWKYIVSEKGEELYNLKNDPYEQNNVIQEHPDIVSDLRKLLKKFLITNKELISIKNICSRIKNR